MKIKILVILASIAIIAGLLSGCIEDEQTQEPTNEPPVSGFTYPEEIYVNRTFTFTDTSTDDTGIESWLWDFGDNTTSTLQNPEHTYLEPRIFTVTLTVTDAEGETDTITKSVEVLVYYEPPSVEITYTPAVNITNTTEVTFTAIVTEGDGEVADTGYTWLINQELQDSNTSELVYTFEEEGDYYVYVSVIDENGKTAYDEIVITVISDEEPDEGEEEP